MQPGNGRTEEEIVGPGGLLAQLTKRLVERAMEVELTPITSAVTVTKNCLTRWARRHLSTNAGDQGHQPTVIKSFGLKSVAVVLAVSLAVHRVG